MKEHLLFCCEKWCAGTPLMGLTNNFHNMFNSFSQTQPQYNYNSLHLDESQSVYGTAVDSVLINYVLKFKPKIIIFCLLGGSNANPQISTYQALKDLGVKLCFMWPDTADWAIPTILELGSVADLSVSWDNPTSDFHSNINFPDTHEFLWVPQDGNFFFDDQKTIDVSFIGSTSYPDRYNTLSQLVKRHNVCVRGGQRSEQLTAEQYAEIIRSSKICLNFSKSPCQKYEQTKGRVYEALRSKCLLFESSNPATRKYLKPSVDYVEFQGLEDLCTKIDFYLQNNEKRCEIANHGFETYCEKYSSQKFWDTVLEKLNEVHR
tara:strand:+ start:1627 stop:2583 length:957 start_codon:yes stop_codon:yes gene_type:complete